MRMVPTAIIFECLVPGWWSVWEGPGGVAFGGSVLLGVDLEVSKANTQPRLSALCL